MQMIITLDLLCFNLNGKKPASSLLSFEDKNLLEFRGDKAGVWWLLFAYIEENTLVRMIDSFPAIVILLIVVCLFFEDTTTAQNGSIFVAPPDNKVVSLMCVEELTGCIF